MSEFANLLLELSEDQLQDIVLKKIGRIEKFDRVKMRADVLPLGKRKSGDFVSDWSILANVPVEMIFSAGSDFWIRPEYKRGDLVSIDFSARRIIEALRGESVVESEVLFAPENATISGSVTKTNATNPAPWTEPGLLVGETGSYIQFNGGIMFLGSKDAAESFVLGDELKTEIEKLRAQVEQLKTDFSSWTPVPMDGGAALKIKVSAGFLTKPSSSFSEILSDKIKGE